MKNQTVNLFIIKNLPLSPIVAKRIFKIGYNDIHEWIDLRIDEALTQEKIQVMQLLTHKLATLEV